MTVATTLARIQYAGNGSTTSFAFSAPFINPADVVVSVVDNNSNPISSILNGATTYDYAVSGTQDVATGEYLSGANFVFNTAPPSGWTVTLFRDPPETQITVLDSGGKYPAKTVEATFDKVTMLIQALKDYIGRSLQAPPTDPGAPPLNLVLPRPTLRANQVLAFDANGNVTVLPYSVISNPLYINATGIVLMIRTSDSKNDLSVLATWVTYLPNGTVLNTAGSTTQGLQESIDYARIYGFDLIVRGGGSKAASSFGAYDGQNPAIIFATTTVDILPLENVTFTIHGASLITTAAIGVRTDSILVANLDLFTGGQIVASANGAVALKFSPRNPVPTDNLFVAGIGTVNVRTGSIVCSGTGNPTCIQFDRSAAPIAFSNKFEFVEPNGGAIGIYITNGAHAFSDNQVIWVNAHGQTTQSLLIGSSDDGNTSLINGNKWIGDLHPGPGAIGVETWGKNDFFSIEINAGGVTAAIGIKLQATADGNIIDDPQIVACTTPIQDNSTSRGNIVRGHPAYVDVDLGGADVAGIADTTWTKVLFNTINYDTNAVHNDWDNTNHRWIPGAVGVYDIDARVGWTTTADGATLRIGIYKNGSLMHGGEALTVAKGTNGGQGAQISRKVHAELTTDYFEIWVEQTSGGAQTLSGATQTTWATFTRLAA